MVWATASTWYFNCARLSPVRIQAAESISASSCERRSWEAIYPHPGSSRYCFNISNYKKLKYLGPNACAYFPLPIHNARWRHPALNPQPMRIYWMQIMATIKLYFTWTRIVSSRNISLSKGYWTNLAITMSTCLSVWQLLSLITFVLGELQSLKRLNECIYVHFEVRARQWQVSTSPSVSRNETSKTSILLIWKVKTNRRHHHKLFTAVLPTRQ